MYVWVTDLTAASAYKSSRGQMPTWAQLASLHSYWTLLLIILRLFKWKLSTKANQLKDGCNWFSVINASVLYSSTKHASRKYTEVASVHLSIFFWGDYIMMPFYNYRSTVYFAFSLSFSDIVLYKLASAWYLPRSAQCHFYHICRRCFFKTFFLCFSNL